MPTTMNAVIAFIGNLEDGAGVDRILAALQASHDKMMERRAASVKVGDDVRLVDATPRYLDGLAGTLIEAEDGYGMVELSVESTGRLRFMPDNGDFAVGGDSRYIIPSVSLMCCETISADRSRSAA